MTTLDPDEIPVLPYAQKTREQAFDIGVKKVLTGLCVLSTGLAVFVVIDYGVIYVNEVGSSCGTAIGWAASLLRRVTISSSFLNLAMLIFSALVLKRASRTVSLIAICTVLSFACIASPLVLRFAVMGW